ncbi:unnamed protein product [Rotaria sp. Silwood1]|nr:unnamed protein product [Rotaria sp. Silwood1]CAF1657604.1 unnamed protein product [Rotaria sp. Silwood1]CAF3837049.1 unnamed protein product [Rotaria sp. Silwood1]CAF3874820.1 unnamed protein product [Rotaria sp. Silwood1]
MPSEIIHCVLCDRRERGARSKFTTITTMERQQKVYEAYEKRHGQPLNYSLINRKVHCSCYRALTFSFTPVPVVNRTGRPKLYKRPRRYNLTTTNTSTNHQSSFINIQRNYSQQNEAQSSSVELNMNMKMVNDYYSEEENAQRSNVINVISAAAVDDKSFEIASMTPGGTQADDDNHNYQSSEDEDCYIEWTTPAIFSSNSIQNYSMIPKKINSNEEDEYVNLKNRNEKENVRAYRAKTGTTSSSRRSHRIQTKLHEAPPCPQNLLGNELYRHERSEQLLTITNRLGHTPSYDTIVRLHVEAAERARLGSKPLIYPRQEISPGDHNFVVKVADNFDINPDRLHGNNSIHILNQIIISTPENNELPAMITDCVNDLLDKIMNSIISTPHRIDVVFDEVESNILKRLIKVHGRNNDNTMYQLRGDDRLQLPFRQFAHCNRVVLAKCIRQCWMESDLIKYLPLGRLLVVGGPDTTAVKLQNGQAPQVDYLLESNHSESRTRLLLHTNIISLDQLQKTVIIDTTDTDVILLAIALGSTIMLHHLIIKSTSTRTKKNTFIDVKSIATGLRQAAIDPTCLLVLHSLSGCDTTSFIRNITKEKVFSYFFDYPDQYSSINKLNCIPPPYEAIAACEQLLINCYSFGRMVHSLDELRAMKLMFLINVYLVAEVRMKDRTRTNIASSLPPSTSSFHQHCLRAARQVKIWLDCLDSNPTTPSMLDSGYKNVDSIDRFKIKWNDLPDQPSDSRLITCGDCKTNCKRCKCWKNNISCTIYCKCNVDSCINQPNTQSITSLTSNDFLIDDSSDDARSTDASIQSDRECDDDSFISESESIYNQTDDSEIYMDNYDRTNDELNLNNCVIDTSTAALQDNLSLHILHDHNYSIDDSNSDSILNFSSTPKRRRTATMTSDIHDTSTPSSSPLIHSTPKAQTITSSTTTFFVTLDF